MCTVVVAECAGLLGEACNTNTRIEHSDCKKGNKKYKRALWCHLLLVLQYIVWFAHLSVHRWVIQINGRIFRNGLAACVAEVSPKQEGHLEPPISLRKDSLLPHLKAWNTLEKMFKNYSLCVSKNSSLHVVLLGAENHPESFTKLKFGKWNFLTESQE